MIKDFYAHAKPSNNNAKNIFVGLLGAAAMIMVAYFTAESYKGIIGLFAVVAITAAVLVYTKYIGVEYYYDITSDSNGSPVFVVRQIIGKRQTTLCRVDLHNITKIERISREEKRKHKTEARYKKYSYLPTIAPAYSLLIKLHSESENAEIFIEAPDEFGNLLLSYAKEARELRFED